MKKFLIAFLLVALVLPFEANAVTHPIFGPKLVTLRTTTGTRYLTFMNSTLSDNAIIRQPVAAAGTVSYLTAQVTNAPGVGNSYVASLYKNGAITALTCTIADTATSCTDSTNSVPVSIGDDVVWAIATVGTTGASQGTIAGKFEAYSSLEAHISGTTAATTNTDGFYSLVGGVASTTESAVSMIAPTAFVLDQLYCRVSGSPAAGNSFAYTLYLNGSPTSLGCSINDTNTTANDLTDSVSVAVGDTLSIHFDASGTPTARFQTWGMRIRPTIAGEYPLMSVTVGIISTALTQFSSPWFTGSGFSNESSGDRVSPLDFTWRKLYAFFDPAPGSGKSWTVVSRDNGVDGAQSVVVSDTAQSGQETSDSDTITTGETIALETTPSGTPATVMLSKFSSVSYVAPPTARLLDTMTQPTFAFSLSRYLRGGEDGNPVVRLREDGGNTELDFKLNGSNVLVSDDINEDTVSEWLTANSASNAYVTILYDQSGRRNHFTQSDTTMQPLLSQSSALNSLTGILFNNAEHRLATSTLDITGSSGIEIHALVRPQTLGTTDSFIFSNGAVSLGAVYVDSSNWVWQADLAEEMLSSTVPSTNTNYLASFRYLTGLTHVIEENCTTVFSGNNPSGEEPDWRSNSEEVIGNSSAAAADRPFVGIIAEMIVYNGVFSSGDLDEVQQSLATQGGVSGCSAAAAQSLPYRLYNLGQMLFNNGTFIIR